MAHTKKSVIELIDNTVRKMRILRDQKGDEDNMITDKIFQLYDFANQIKKSPKAELPKLINLIVATI